MGRDGLRRAKFPITKDALMNPNEQMQDQPARQLTAEEIGELKAAEQQLAEDLREAGEASKRRSSIFDGSGASLLDRIVDANERDRRARDMIESDLARELFAADGRLARVFATSGAFSDIKGTTANQAIAMAMTKIRLGRSWGMNEGDSMMYIFFTNGRPSVMSEYLASKLAKSGIGWSPAFDEDKDGRCTGCTLMILKNGESLMEPDPTDPNPDPAKRRKRWARVSFTKADADKAMIWEKGRQIPLSSKWNFVSWPEDMYFWRCISRLKKRYAPDILSGAVSVDEAQE